MASQNTGFALVHYLGDTNEKIEHTSEYIEHTNELQAANLNKNNLHVVVGFWKRAL